MRLGRPSRPRFNQASIPNSSAFAAFTLAGLFGGFAGLYYSFVTTTRDAGIGPGFTLISIAAVVLGGELLRAQQAGGVFVTLLGLAVLNTGGLNHKGGSSTLKITMASGDLLGLPVSFLIWIAISLARPWLLTRTPLGRYLRSIGYNEKATFLSVMQIGNALRNIIFGVIILVMLLFQTLRKEATA
ncbi:MAG: hypothetical protein HW564_18225 [Ruegeria pomeroyi]|uniref:Uncharacterized protein n=1 Tax=Ruegeria pomeroyi TaxID=89184 RepID=A0A850LLK1_9RHOB|nr:hypothetical protein [Ruegeria pomeroyi]NVK98868.1 hypothetical protein [Ruegeria pomeroyi]